MGTSFIPEVFGIRHSLLKFLVFAETSSFPLALDPENMEKIYVKPCSSSAAWQRPASTVRPSRLRASVFTEVIIYHRDLLFT